MKSVVKVGPQPGVELVDIPVPTPGPGEILIKVAAICGTDLRCSHWKKNSQDFGEKYNILAHECTGVLAAVGEEVTEQEVDEAYLAGAPVNVVDP